MTLVAIHHSQFKVYQLMKTSKKFTAYGQRNHLNCLGYFKASLRAGMKTISSKVYVIQGQAEALLGRNACIELGIIRQVMPIKVESNVNQKTKTCFDNLIEEYNDIFTGLGKIAKFEHKISVNPNVKPVSQKLRRIPFGQIESVDREIDKMLNDSVIEDATQPSPWVSNLVVVPKSSGGVRVCCDLRELNKVVVRERHVLPKVEDTLQNLRGSKYFAKIDLKSGFFQLDLAEESRYLTIFITHRGCFRFKRTPFGLNDVSEQFQKVMEQILFGLQGVEISVDDVIIHAKSLEELIVRIRAVFARCREYNLRLNPDKCMLGLTEMPVLGHVISAEGIKPDPSKTEAMCQAPLLTNVLEIRSFLGTCGYLAKFIPNYAETVEPLRRLTRKGVKWQWGNEQNNAIETLKKALSSEPVLACFKLENPTFVVADASPVGLGAVLLQKQDDLESVKPIAYVSRSLSQTERRYSQIEREALRLRLGRGKIPQLLVWK